MRYFFDTSALLPTFLEDHEHHEASLRAFLIADKDHSCCAAHTLAEIYTVATRLPGKHRLSGEQALLFLEEIIERLSIITLTGEEYFQVMKKAASSGIPGGIIYDALLLRCALKSAAETICTWNVKHFQQSALNHQARQDSRTISWQD